MFGGAYKKMSTDASQQPTDQIRIGQEVVERKKHTYQGIMQERQKN